MHKAEAVLTSAARAPDMTQPLAILLMGVLGHIGDDAKPIPSSAVWSTRCRPASTSTTASIPPSSALTL